MARRRHERDEGHKDQLLWVRTVADARGADTPNERIDSLLLYLEAFPLGIYNRDAAEAVERALFEVNDLVERGHLSRRLRALREAHMPEVEPDSWEGIYDGEE